MPPAAISVAATKVFIPDFNLVITDPDVDWPTCTAAFFCLREFTPNGWEVQQISGSVKG
jgi:hypothetical protein